MPSKLSLLLLVVLAFAIACEQAPAWPDGAKLEAAEIKGTTVTLEWPEAGEKVTAYKIRKGDAVIAELESDATTYTAKNLEGQTEYKFSVLASDKGGNWSQPLDAAVKTLDASPPTWPEDSELNVKVESKGALGAKVTFTWTPAEDDTGVTQYQLKREGEVIETWPASQESFEHQSVEVEGLYTLYAGDEAGNWSEDGPSARVWANKGMKNLLNSRGFKSNGPSLNLGIGQ